MYIGLRASTITAQKASTRLLSNLLVSSLYTWLMKMAMLSKHSEVGQFGTPTNSVSMPSVGSTGLRLSSIAPADVPMSASTYTKIRQIALTVQMI